MKDNPHVDIISSKNVYWYLLVDCHTSLVHKQLVLRIGVDGSAHTGGVHLAGSWWWWWCG